MSSSKTKKPMKVKELSDKIGDDIEKAIEDDDVWSVVRSFVNENGLVSAQIHSFNDLIYHKAHQIVDMFKQVVIEEKSKKYILELGELMFGPPTFMEKDESTHDLYPIEALQRNITYGSVMYVDVTVTTPSGETTFYEKKELGVMPIMVKSDLCHASGYDEEKLAQHKEDFYDNGGYFVVAPKGEGAVSQRRILIPQERSAPNKIYIFSGRKAHPKYSTYAEVRSTSNNVHTITTTVGFLRTGAYGRISVVLPWIDATEIPLGVLFFALGITDYKTIAMFIVGPSVMNSEVDCLTRDILQIITSTLEYSYEIKTKEDALFFIGKKGRKFVKNADPAEVDDLELDIDDLDVPPIDELVEEISERSSAISYAKHLLSSEFFSHVGNYLSNDLREIEKAKYLGYVVRKLILVLLGKKKPESRDHYMNKRILTSGALLAQQFYGGLRRLIMEITKNTKKALLNGNTVNISSWIKPSIITNTMQGAITGNNWTSGGPAAKGISQLYEQFNYVGSIANSRKVTVPIAAEGGKVIEPRDLHGSHFGGICVTGDTLVLLADGKTLCRIDQLVDKPVMTVNPVTLAMEPSEIYNFFKMMPKSLIRIKDDCGRILKCTQDHPFLVRRDDKNVWVDASILKVEDDVIVVDINSLAVKVSKVKEISEIEPEMVYDFTTISENHSFVSNEFVTHQCPADTPEGKKAGLVKNLAFLAHITVGSDFDPIRLLIEKMIGDRAVKKYPESLGWARVFLNGTPIGLVSSPEKLATKLRRYRREGKVTAEMSVSETQDEVNVFIDAGRLCRPLLIVEDGKLKLDTKVVENLNVGEMSWTDLLASGAVELIDKEEEETCNIIGFPSQLEALSPDIAKRYTHCEIHPSLIYGVSGSIIPFSNHNQCIFQEEVVYMEKGMKKKVKDVVEGDRVINFDPKTGVLGTATVIATKKTKTNKQMYQLVLETGQTLKATFDHRIITPKGWKRIDCLSEGDFVGVYPSGLPLGYLTFTPIAFKIPVDTKLISDITTDSPNQSFFCGDGFGVHNSPRNCYQCIWKEEPVLMGDGTWRPIKDIKIGDEVITFHPKTMETSITKVINHFVKETTKKIVEVTTVSGRKIVVTEDHKIMTESGWVKAGDLEGHKVAISMLPDNFLTFVPVLSVFEKPNVEIADITVDSENHSFIAGDGFCVHNSSMGKQAVGVPFSNYREIMCGSFHTLMYLQKPLCLTRAGSIVRFHQMPAGQNAIVAIMPRPFNEEDSIEMNADSIQRGFMVSFKWTCFYAEVREENSEIFGIPEEKNTEKFRGNPRHLLPSGFPKPGSKIENGDIVIGKLICNGEGDIGFSGTSRTRKRYTNASQMYDHVWPAVVDKIMHGTTGDGYKFIRVMLCQRREPIVGDKFSFMHGQKGTVGMIMRSEDLPFNSQGISPDIVVNSLALPSRMTIAMLIEDWTGKAIISTSRLHDITVNEVLNHADNSKEPSKTPKPKSGPSKEFSEMFCRHEHPAERPAMIDSTPFRKFDRNIIAEEMKKYGLQYGDEFLTDGVTGKRLRSLVFFGPAYSQRLKHMVVDKIHSRAKGGKTTLMRQPLEGRAMGGGLRFGVMERDCMLGQGSSKFVRDRLFICSDDYRTWYCDICGLIAGNPEDGCKVCGQNKLSKIRIPYGTKLVDQELMAMNIVPRILTVPRKGE